MVGQLNPKSPCTQVIYALCFGLKLVPIQVLWLLFGYTDPYGKDVPLYRGQIQRNGLSPLTPSTSVRPTPTTTTNSASAAPTPTPNSAARPAPTATPSGEASTIPSPAAGNATAAARNTSTGPTLQARAPSMPAGWGGAIGADEQDDETADLELVEEA